MSTLAVKCLVSLDSFTLTEDVFSKGTEVVGISEEELEPDVGRGRLGISPRLHLVKRHLGVRACTRLVCAAGPRRAAPLRASSQSSLQL